MRVLMVMCNLLAGGAEVTALRLVRSLARLGYQFTIAPIQSRGVLGPAFQQAGAEVCQAAGHLRWDPLAACRLAAIIRQRAIDALIMVNVPRNAMFYGFVGAAMSLRRLSRICWCHSNPAGQSGNFVWQLKAYRAAGMVDVIVSPSRWHRRMLIARGLKRRRMLLIPNGIELGAAAEAAAGMQLPPGKHIIVQVANVMPDKDHRTLLKAAGILARSRDDFHVVLVGDGTDSPDMAASAQAAGAAAVVTLAGRRTDVASILRLADLFVLATKREVFSVAALEAMAAGLPVIVSDIEAFDEMFSHGREGLKFPVGDADALAGAIRLLLDDPGLQGRMASAARQRAERFAVEKMAAKFDRLLKVLAR